MKMSFTAIKNQTMTEKKASSWYCYRLTLNSKENKQRLKDDINMHVHENLIFLKSMQIQQISLVSLWEIEM